MHERPEPPDLSGYISIDDAASILGLAYGTVYEFVEEGRLPYIRAGSAVLIALEDVLNFKQIKRVHGRPRKITPPWRTSSGNNAQFTIIIHVHARIDQKALLEQKLEAIRRDGKYLFSGTVVRFVAHSETKRGQVIIVLVWRRPIMPDTKDIQAELESFRQELADVLDWSTAQYEEGTVLLHT